MVMTVVTIVLLLLKWITQLWLEWKNEQSISMHRDEVPEAFREIVDQPTYQKSVAYSLAKTKLHQFEFTYDTLILALVLFSGILPVCYRIFSEHFGISVWAGAAFLFVTGLLLSITEAPFDWYSRFRVEQRFGFNTMTVRLWILDRIKGLVLAIVLGYPLLVLVLKLVAWMGNAWWLWAWATIFGFQLVMVVLAPILIMPLFNKFQPLPPGPLRDRLLALGNRTGFSVKTIQVMDGSKRSRHSNAFFTGFKRFRKIVLFDTLIEQLTPAELESVVAHEIGHYRKGHIPKMLAVSAVSLLVALFSIHTLLHQEWFFKPFGFQAGDIVAALLLFTLLGGIVTFWFSPLGHWWSRKYEYEADRYAAETTSDAASMVSALRKLNEKNLSNLTPHCAYSGFYYSHPTLLERERALQRLLSPSKPQS